LRARTMGCSVLVPTKVRATGMPASFSRREKPSTISSSGRLRRPASASQSVSAVREAIRPPALPESPGSRQAAPHDSAKKAAKLLDDEFRPLAHRSMTCIRHLDDALAARNVVGHPARGILERLALVRAEQDQRWHGHTPGLLARIEHGKPLAAQRIA